MADGGGTQFDGATVTIKFVADMSDVDRAQDALDQRIAALPSKFSEAIGRIDAEFTEKFSAWQRKLDDLSDGFRSAGGLGLASEARAQEKQGGDGLEEFSRAFERRMSEVMDEMKKIEQAIEGQLFRT